MNFFGLKVSPVYVLYLSSFIMSFIFWGMQSVMITNIAPELFDKSYLYSVYGTFVFFSFGSTLVGGTLADKYLGHYSASMVGVLSLLLGTVLLSFNEKLYGILGISFCCIGYAFLSTNKSVLLSSLFDSKSEISCRKAFSISYAWVNAGALIGPIFFGFVLRHLNWHKVFSYITVLLLFYCVLFIKVKPLFKVNKDIDLRSMGISLIIILSMSFIFCYGFIFPDVVYTSSIIIFSFVALYLFYLIITRKDYKSIVTISTLTIFLIIFYGIFFQINSSLIPIYEESVNKYIFGLEIPSSMFVSIEPGFVVLVSPILTYLLTSNKRNNFVLQSIFIAFFLEGVSFLIFALAFKDLSHKVSMIWPLSSCFILAIAEFFISPITAATVATISPKDLKGRLVGISQVSLGLSGVISGCIATFIANNSDNIAINFIFLSIFSLTFAVMAALGSRLKLVINDI